MPSSGAILEFPGSLAYSGVISGIAPEDFNESEEIPQVSPSRFSAYFPSIKNLRVPRTPNGSTTDTENDLNDCKSLV
jgi:hypothetical protein